MAPSTEERRIVTVLFADMAGSTALGENLDPEEVRRLLTRYYAIAREVVDEHGGTIEKFIGDAVMAVFGLPTAHGDDADRAVAAAQAMKERIQSDRALDGKLAIRFGVSTGEVVASRDQSAGDFLITGDATNVAARLQQAADAWAILVSDRTARSAANFDFSEEIAIQARGKSTPVIARRLIGPRRARPARQTRLPLVGRETELSQLQLVARRAINEKRPSIASVIAPAGTGKTRLVEEFLDWLPNLAPDALVATAQCLPYGQQLTYWPMRQVLFQLTGHAEDAMPSNFRDELASWLHGIGVDEADQTAKLLAATVGETGGEGVDKDLLFAAWRTLVEAVARRHPLVIVFEDLHWSSESLLDLAEFVMQPRGAAPVLMLVLARPELLDRRPNWGGGRLNHLAIALDPLPDIAIADLVRHLLDTDAPEVVELVAARSEGNPFYAGELVRSFLEQGSLEKLPDTVQATVLARLDLLPADERRVLQLGSVFGRAFRAGGVAALERRDDDTQSVKRLCDDLASRDLVRPAEGDRYTFRHILIQEVAYSTLPRAERARLHLAAARWLESASEGRETVLAEILAFHYREAALLWSAVDPSRDEAADARAQAARWLLKAADVAAAAGATPEAVRHIRAAFDYVDAGLLPRLHERIGDLTAGDAGLEDYRQALELYDAHDAPADDRLRAVAGLLLVAMRWVGSVGGRPSEQWIADMRGRGRELLAQSTDEFAIARFLMADAFYPFWMQGVRELATDEVDMAVASAERAREIAIELDDPELLSAALDAQTGIAVYRKDWAEARRLSEERIKFENRLSLAERMDAHTGVVWMCYFMGDLETGERVSAQMAARLLPGQAPYTALHLFAWRVLTLYTLGRWEEAVATFWRAIEAWHDAGSHAAGYALRGFVPGLDIGRARGDPRLISAAGEAIDSIGSRFGRNHPNHLLLGYLRGDSGLGIGDRRLDRFFSPDLLERQFNLASDRREQLAGETLEWAIDRVRTGTAPLLQAQVLRAVALARHEPSQLARAVEIWRRVGAVPQLGRGLAEHGVLAGDSRETEDGLSMLKKVGDLDYVDRFSARV